MGWDKDRIVELLLRAGDMAREARKKLTLEIKSDHSLVTQADLEIEALFTEALEDEAAGCYIIGEETISRKGDDYVAAALESEAWVVDPIDGTAPFAHFLPNWGVSIGYMKAGKLLHGGVYLPDYGELIISSGDDEFIVHEGKETDGEWAWRELSFPPRPSDGRGLIAITQALAKRGQCLLPNPVMALGAPGGRKVLTSVLQSILNTVDYGLGIQEALSAPRIHSETGTLSVDDRLPSDVVCALRKKGHNVVLREETYISSYFGRPSAVFIDREKNLLRSGLEPYKLSTAVGI